MDGGGGVLAVVAISNMAVLCTTGATSPICTVALSNSELEPLLYMHVCVCAPSIFFHYWWIIVNSLPPPPPPLPATPWCLFYCGISIYNIYIRLRDLCAMIVGVKIANMAASFNFFVFRKCCCAVGDWNWMRFN